MSEANGDETVPDTWDFTKNGAEATCVSQSMKLNVNALVFTPGQNVFAQGFIPNANEEKQISLSSHSTGTLF